MPQRHGPAHELSQLPPFVHCSREELRRVERLRTRLSVRPGTVLARQGCQCLEFGVIVEGTACVTRDGHELELLEPGQYFGEIGMVLAVPNPATIVTCSAMRLDVMSRQEFRSAYSTMLSMRVHIACQIDRRIATWLGQRPCVPATLQVRALTTAQSGDYTLAS